MCAYQNIKNIIHFLREAQLSKYVLQIFKSLYYNLCVCVCVCVCVCITATIQTY